MFFDIGQAAKSGAIAECTFESRICKDDNVIMPELCQVEAPRFFNSPLTVDRTVPVDKDSLEKDDPHQRRLGRRGVLIIQRKHAINLMANVVVYNLNIKVWYEFLD
ncbi:hypothetical protein MKW98_031941 [Papaver atlanticum]|uniref:Uncharacterized protein n=1 Tax=Papaver atlanticum TaxID=357466 RepID=A0AAD4XEB2_9MAGN|nr:hypothetical protein MKW98_031941 [Papaver atlanticum]